VEEKAVGSNPIGHPKLGVQMRIVRASAKILNTLSEIQALSSRGAFVSPVFAPTPFNDWDKALWYQWHQWDVWDNWSK
jgi:hypothetical protein